MHGETAYKMFGNMKYSIIPSTVDTAGCFFTLIIRGLNNEQL